MFRPGFDGLNVNPTKSAKSPLNGTARAIWIQGQLDIRPVILSNSISAARRRRAKASTRFSLETRCEATTDWNPLSEGPPILLMRQKTLSGNPIARFKDAVRLVLFHR